MHRLMNGAATIDRRPRTASVVQVFRVFVFAAAVMISGFAAPFFSGAPRLLTAGAQGNPPPSPSCSVFNASKSQADTVRELTAACEAQLRRGPESPDACAPCLCQVSSEVLAKGGMEWDKCTERDRMMYGTMGRSSIDAAQFAVQPHADATCPPAVEAADGVGCAMARDDETTPEVFDAGASGYESVQEYCEALYELGYNELDKMYHEAAPKPSDVQNIPKGCVPGCIIGNYAVAQLARGQFGWNGKCFFPGESWGASSSTGGPPNLWNYALPGPLLVIPGRYQPNVTSWFDNKPTTALDYISDTFWINAVKEATNGALRDYSDYHDEIREVKPGMFLGQMFLARGAEGIEDGLIQGVVWPAFNRLWISLVSPLWYNINSILGTTTMHSDICYSGNGWLLGGYLKRYICPQGDVRENGVNLTPIPLKVLHFAVFQSQSGLQDYCIQPCSQGV